MDDQKRTKILAGGLALVILVFLLRSKADEWLRGSIRRLQSEVADAEKDAETLQEKQRQLQVAQSNLAKWQGISLPPDVDNAQRLYREWVQTLAEECGFSRIDVVPASKATQKEYSTVAVDVRRAETDLQGLAKFLYLFDQAKMLHRISSMTIDSPSLKPNPRLTISFTAEGMSAAGAEDHQELLARTSLMTAVNDSEKVIVTAPSDLFPIAVPPEEFEPFLVRIDRELMKVAAVTENGWQVVRGAEETKAATHDANSVVELFPVAWDRKEKTLEQYASFVNASPFVIPSPPKKYTPRITGVSDKTIKSGEEVEFTAKADGLDSELGAAQFALTDAADGMTIDAASGKFVWKPVAELAPGEYTATVLMTQEKNADVRIDAKLKITIKQPNTAPTITLIESAIVVLGKEFTTTATATDVDATDTLKFSLGGGSPEGLVIDEKTGQLKWTPPKTFTPGKYDVEVKVTDSADEPKSAAATIALDVQDDFASLTILSGIVGKDGVLHAWFRNKATDKVNPLKEGEKLTVSEISAEIVSITDRFVTLRDAEGLWKLRLGDGLRQRVLIEPAEKPAATEPTAATPEPVTPEPATPEPVTPEPVTPEPVTPEPAT
ncbi:MAG: putative Ig domain-containing protein, partial [Fuerstia sp.]|nr:putative Ig domain-containing protein [Fuerstiella sp.]